MAAVSEAGIYEEDFTVPGADVGDVALVSFTQELRGATLTALVVAPNTVRVQLLNNTARSISVARGDLRITVHKH